MNSLLPSAWSVPEIFRKRLGELAGRQRTMSADGHLLLVLHEVPEPGVAERKSVLFWRDPAGVWRATGNGSGLAELDSLLQGYIKGIDGLESRMLAAPSADNYFSVLQTATPLLRSTRNLHRALQEARELFREDRHILLARDQAGEQERTVELLHSDARNGLDYMIARQAEEQARNSDQLVVSSYRLNLLVAIFLPLTALGSAFGMNFVHGLEGVRSPLLFWSVLVLGILVGFVVKGAVAIRPVAKKAALPRVGR
ncbi:MAG TPA: CorA family divalent cation transporter [Chthoniobacteraceae bacterium]|jgi:hypothetical protein